MSLINPAILYGLGLAIVPVILHFLLRSRPKKLLFPALRLLQIRRKNNVRRLRLRHIWLLLLRVLVIALLVLAIARPSLPAANYAPNFRESLTLAAVMTLGAAVYWAALSFWRSKRMTHPDLLYRRSLLRGGVAAATVLLLLLFFIWPYQRRIAAEIVSPMPEVALNLPASAVFLFDTSLSMEYRYESKTRLEVAQDVAGEQLSRFPQGSRIAVADTTSDDPMLFQADLKGAVARIEGLRTSPRTMRLNDRLRSALSLHEDDRRRLMAGQDSLPEEKRTDRFLREIYVFTDLARSAWQTRGSTFLRDELKRLDWCQLYIIDVGVEKPTNIGITQLALAKQTVPLGGDLVVTGTIEAVGHDETIERTVELYVENKAGEPVKQGQQSISLNAQSATRVTFSVPGLPGPVGRGEMRLISSDPYTIDDVRYFAVAVRPPPQILIVSDSFDEAVYLRTALSPPELERLGKNAYRCTFVTSAELGDTELKAFEVVCLVNVRHPSQENWKALSDYVGSGGGLAVFLGMRNGSLNPVSAAYANDVADAFLPARLLADLSLSPPATLDLRNHVHPLLQKVESMRGIAELTSAPVERYWRVEPAEGASVIAEFTDARHSPALLERPFGDGRTMMLTTAVDLNQWSDLPRTWAFINLTDSMMQYLGGRSADAFNFSAGDDVVLRREENPATNQYLLRQPNLQQTRVEVKPDAATVVVHDADQLGQYRLGRSEGESPVDIGFCVNPPTAESDATTIGADDLNNLLGEGRYSVSKDVETLRSNVSQGRIGKEVFSLVLAFMIAIFCMEHIVANRFYEADQAVEHR
ncbi:MAG: BatA and WFA domain-containing protein [Planctomycetaceae bacterium]